MNVAVFIRKEKNSNTLMEKYQNNNCSNNRLDQPVILKLKFENDIGTDSGHYLRVNSDYF